MLPKIALLLNFVPPYRLPLFRELDRRSQSLRIFVSAQTEPGRDWQPQSGGLRIIPQDCFHWRKQWRHSNQVADVSTVHFPYDTIQRLAASNPDVIVSGELGLRTLQAAIYRTLVRKSRLVIWATLSEITERRRGRIRPLLRRVLFKSADAVIVNGRSGARYVSRMGADRKKVFLAPQTTDLSSLLGIPSARSNTVRRRLLYAGRLIELKGLVPFLTHLREWAVNHSSRSVDFWILGDGPLRETLAHFPGPPNLRLRLLGHCPYERLHEIYSQCGILVFPTLADEWGLTVVEAMASGLPVLGSLNSQAVEDLVVDGKTGWTFGPDNELEITSALDRSLLASIDELASMSEAARAAVKKMTPASMADQISSAIEYARASHPSRPQLLSAPRR